AERSASTADVGDERVESGPTLAHLAECITDWLRLRQISPHLHDSVSRKFRREFLFALRQRILVAARNHDACAFLQKAARDCFADAAGRAGDERHLISKFQVHFNCSTNSRFRRAHAISSPEMPRATWRMMSPL